MYLLYLCQVLSCPKQCISCNEALVNHLPAESYHCILLISMFILFNISILNSSRFTCKANRVDLWGWKFHLIRPLEPSLGVATTFGVEVMQVNQIWLTITDNTRCHALCTMYTVHTTIQMIYSTSVCFGFTLTSRLSSRYSGMRGCKKCETCNQPDKRPVKSVKLRTALKSIRPTNFHTLVNQGFCGSTCALGQKCNQTKTFRNVEHATAFEIRMKTISDKGTV